MPDHDLLTPQEASHIATNAYFTLENWINKKPLAGVECRPTIQNRVLGDGSIGSNQPTGNGANPTLKGTGLAKAKIVNVHEATTGISTHSGFGYTLVYRGNGRTHAIIAMRGTRPELANFPDLLTDAHGTITGFGGMGPVHKGFKRTFESVLPNLERDSKAINGADVLHVVGHSLGGAVATLIAAHYAGRGKPVNLYTFGSPRVGGMGGHALLEKRIGKQNIFRVAHDLDPISLIGPFPYIHVNGAVGDLNNMTLISPTRSLLSTANHDMAGYIDSAGTPNMTWGNVRLNARHVNHDNSLLARWLLHGDDSGWVKYASVQTLSVLFKLLSHALRTVSTCLVLGLTAVDLLAEVLIYGMHKTAQLGAQILKLLGYAAEWAGIQITSGAQFTAAIISRILEKMLATLRHLAAAALAIGAQNIDPVPLVMGTWSLLSHSVF